MSIQRQHQYQVESADRMLHEAVAEAQKALGVTVDVLDHKQKILQRELVRLRKQQGLFASERDDSSNAPSLHHDARVDRVLDSAEVMGSISF